ncbi:MAG: hypothetical protein ACREFF_00650 [Candidatus Udaeobacter sp.]
MTDQNITETQSKKSGTDTWSQVIRLIEAHPDVKQVRLNINDHSVTVGFYETPSEQARNQIKAEVRAQLPENGTCRSCLTTNRRPFTA